MPKVSSVLQGSNMNITRTLLLLLGGNLFDSMKNSLTLVSTSYYLIKIRSPASNYMFQVNNRNTRTRCEICSKLTIKTPERCKWRRPGVFIVNFEHISHLF